MLCDGNTRFKHGREVGRLFAGETEVGAAEALKCQQRVRAAFIPGRPQALAESFKALARHIRHQGIAVAEMAVGRRRADAGLPGRFGEGETGGTLLRNEVKCSADQRLAQVAVVVAATPAAAVSGPAHKRDLAHSAAGDIFSPRYA